MQYKIIRKLAYIYISLPLLVFSMMWLNTYSTLFFTSCLLISFYCTIKQTDCSNSFKISPKTFYWILLIAFIWVFLSGIGGWWYQSEDFSARNAIYRDLINYSWPVYYPEQNFTLNYYFGFWLIPALITKLIVYFFAPDNYYFIGMQILMIWTFLGVALFLLLVINAIKPQNNYKLALTIIIPIIFSGLDIIGACYLGDYHHEHIDWWTRVQYSSLTTLLFWVFNQTIIPWIATLLLFTEKSPRNFGIIFITTLFSAPLPAVGLAILMIACILKYFYDEIKEKDLKKFFKTLFSLSNIFSSPFLYLLYSFYTINTIYDQIPLQWKPFLMVDYINFCLIEFLCYIFLIFKFYKKDILFHVTILSLFLLCLLSIGATKDFQMRTTIPAILLLMLYILKYINTIKVIGYRELILFIFRIIGSVTPFHEVRRGFTNFIDTGNIFHIDDQYKTFKDKNIKEFPFFNYLVKDPQPNIFYKYFSKELS